MRRHRHDRAGAIGHHDIVGDPDRDARVIDRVDRIGADKHARLLLVRRRALDLALPGRLELVRLHLCSTRIDRQLVHEWMFRGQHHKGRPPQRVGTRGKDLERVRTRRVRPIFRAERDPCTFATPDPVLLHGLDPLGPIDLAEIKQFVGIVRDFKEPLVQLFFDNRRIAPLAVTVLAPDLLAGQGRIARWTKIDRRKGAIGQSHFVHFEKKPLRPAIIARQAGDRLASPVKHRAHRAKLAAHVFDVAHRPLVGVDAPLSRRVLGGKAKGVKPHWKEHIVPAHAQIAGARIRRSHRVPVTDV